jgi:hypothetical protein
MKKFFEFNRALLLAFVSIASPTAGHTQLQRLCICAIPEIPPCAKVCGEPPKQPFKLIEIAKGTIVPITLGSMSYEQVVPGLPGNPSAVDELLANPKARATIKGELEGRAAIAIEQRKAIEETIQKSGIPSAEVKAAIRAYEKDAKRYQDWGAKIGAAEARSKIGSDLRF